MSSGFPEPGEQLGPFRIGRRLGVGGMGVVLQALDTHLNRQVALKVIAPHLSGDPEFRARFTREAQAQASLDSAHVVQVYSFGEADGRLYIASQLIPDGDLSQMLQRHGVPPARIALNLMSQVAAGLADAHAVGLAHRDIKPGNVLLRRRDGSLEAYLGDFGIARQAGDQGLTQAGSTVGTPMYMAPELHLGSEAGPASDLYSLGCLLWASLSGAAPYAGPTDFQVIRAHLEDPVPQVVLTGPLAAEINRVLRTALAKRPEDRYPSAAAMRDDLRRVVRLPDDPTPIRVPGAPASGQPDPAPQGAPGSGPHGGGRHGPQQGSQQGSQQGGPAPWQLAATRPPTPTPTPSRSQAPPAPPFRSTPPGGAGDSPVFTHHDSSYGGRTGVPAAKRRGRVWWVLGAVAVLVVGAVVVAVLLAGGDRGGSADPAAEPSTSVTGGASTDPSTDPSTEPTTGASPRAPDRAHDPGHDGAEPHPAARPGPPRRRRVGHRVRHGGGVERVGWAVHRREDRRRGRRRRADGGRRAHRGLRARSGRPPGPRHREPDLLGHARVHRRDRRRLTGPFPQTSVSRRTASLGMPPSPRR